MLVSVYHFYTMCRHVRGQLDVDNRYIFRGFLNTLSHLPVILFSGRHDFSCVFLTYQLCCQC